MMSLPLPDGFSLHCGAYGVELYKQLNVSLHSVGCSLVAGNDLYDLGFRAEDLKAHGLELRWGSTVLVKWPPETEPFAIHPDNLALPPAHGYGSDTA
jgi:hypothetical protein